MIRFVARDLDGRIWGYEQVPFFNSKTGEWEPRYGRTHRFMDDQYRFVRPGECLDIINDESASQGAQEET